MLDTSVSKTAFKGTHEDSVGIKECFYKTFSLLFSLLRVSGPTSALKPKKLSFQVTTREIVAFKVYAYQSIMHISQILTGLFIMLICMTELWMFYLSAFYHMADISAMTSFDPNTPEHIQVNVRNSSWDALF
jgi:hypothetical protein